MYLYILTSYDLFYFLPQKVFGHVSDISLNFSPGFANASLILAVLSYSLVLSQTVSHLCLTL